MLKSNTPLSHTANDKDFFDSVQFPVEYTFAQDQVTGAVDRSFQQPAFSDGKSVHDKAFALVNHNTGKALTLSDGGCTSSLRIVQQKYIETNLRQQFKLNANDQLESVACPGKVITGSGACNGGDALALSDSTSNSTTQKWRFYNDGIVNHACGQINGNLAVSSIEDDSFDNIPSLDDIRFSFVNPSTGKAIGLRSSVSSWEVKSFFLDR